MQHLRVDLYQVFKINTDPALGIRMFAYMISRTNLEMGPVGSKTRSLGQMLENPCVYSRGHIFRLIFMKLGQNGYLNDTSNVLFGKWVMLHQKLGH